jgi:hypothetical protein
MGRNRHSRSSNRYLRQGRAGTPQSLLRSAGLTDRPTVEQLERRQMLFSLTVTADVVDPVTGLGTVRQAFGYTIPYIGTNVDIEDPQDPTTVTEDFSDEPFGPVGSGQFLLESGIQIRHNIFPAGDIRITAQPQNQDNQDRWMAVNLNQAGEFIRFQFFTPTDAPATPTIVNNVQLIITGDGTGDNTGLLTDNVIVELTEGTNQQVVASFTGAALRALITGNPALGTGTLNLAAPGNAGFDSVRITMLAPPGQGVNPAFRITDIIYSVPQSRFGGLIASRVFYAMAVLTGPVGATASFFDLYGRAMEATIVVLSPDTQAFHPIDTDDDGIPSFNDGIGRIVLSNTDSRTAFTIWGGSAETFDDLPPLNADWIEGRWAFFLETSPIGLYDEFESAGFAYAFDNPPGDDQIRFAGLPAGPGSVVIGSPFIRDNTNAFTYNPTGVIPGVQNPVITGFTRADQGIFVTDGGNMGSIYLHGILHGSSMFNGFVDRIYVGYLVGSITVNGDLGSLVVGTDAGQWAPDPDFSITNPNLRLDPINKTSGQLIVGRTVGEIAIAGRSLLDVTVVGDLNNPATRPARDVFTYYEKEHVLGMNPDREEIDAVRQLINNNQHVARTSREQYNSVDQPMVFGPTFYRNDDIMGAEWISGIASGVRIKGTLSGQDPFQGEDTNDVFAFAADGTQDITVEAVSPNGAPYIRIVDEQGRVLVAPEQIEENLITSRLRFRPKGPGVYYLVIADPTGGRVPDTGATNVTYTIAITGMAVSTLGAYRTGGASGFTDLNTGEGNTIQVLAGNVGSLRIGTGLVDGGGNVISPTGIYNTVQDDDDSLSWQGGSISIAGNLYNITAGSDIGNPGDIGGGSPISVIVGGDFGTLFTGLSPLFADGGSEEGDLNFFNLQVGGRIAAIYVRGGIGVDQDPEDASRFLPIDSFSSITTGINGGSGDIGFIRVGANVAGDSLEIRTSPGSVIGAFLVAQDPSGAPPANSGVFLGQRGVPIFTGMGSDVRFVDTVRMDLLNSVNVYDPIIGDQAVEIVDDGGNRVRISVENAPPGVEVGQIRKFAIDGSQGAAIGRITVDLSGGRVLRIVSVNSGSNPTPISIGRIEITGSDTASAIDISGAVPVDIYRIVSPGGLGTVSNRTGGDIVAMDVASLISLDLRGDLGRTEVPAWGPSLIGPFLGLSGSLVGAVNGELGVGVDIETDDDADEITPYYQNWDGNLFFRPLNEDFYALDRVYLEDIGGPLNGYLNGLVVRTGSVQEVRVDGTIGDIILQDPEGELVSVTANADRFSPLDTFQGISGHIFAYNIGDLDIGDGLLPSDGSPLLSSGIFAMNDIRAITSGKTSGVVVSGVITALNAVDNGAFGDIVDGIGSIQLTNGLVKDASIAGEALDGFWNSFHYDDEQTAQGSIGNIRLTNTTLFRTRIFTINLDQLQLTGPNGYFDASDLAATGLVNQISATGYRNSTLTGTLEEIAVNRIVGARDVNRITAVQDMADLTIDFTGSVRQSISAVNISRTSIDVDGELKSLAVTNDLRGSTVNVGSLPSLTAGRNIQSSSIFVSGNLSTVTAGGRIGNSDIQVTGPGGTIGSITARDLISGNIASAGNIGSITVTAGDLVAVVTTINGGNVNSLSAGRDLAVTGDISGSVATLVAGRHFGLQSQPGVFLVRGTLAGANIANGQLYSDIRVGQNITGVITVGGAPNKVGDNQVGGGSIVSFGSIASIVINGDFDGDIISHSGGIASIAINNGSLLPGNTVAAYNASLGSLIITNGNLYGDVHADVDITLLRVVAGADGVFGDIGVNPMINGTASYDARRNHLPLGVAQNPTIQGPRISAGRNIVAVQVPGGSVFETYFIAGQKITGVSIGGTVQNDFVTLGISSAFIAGDSIDGVTISGGVNNTAFVAGVVSLGAAGRLGGGGANADIIKSGSIGVVNISNGMVDGKFSAGIDPGPDGVYNTSDDRSVQGISTITGLRIDGPVGNVSVFADVLPDYLAQDTRFIRGGADLPSTNPQIDNGAGTPGTPFSGTATFDNVNGASITFTVSGPGQAFFNTATNTLILRNTTSATNLTVSSSTGVINNVKVVTNDDASLGSVTFHGRVTGDSDLVVDGNVASLTYGDFDGVGTISIGGDVGTATFGSFTGGFFFAKTVPTLRINGAFGNLNTTVTNEAKIELLDAGTITITGQAAGVISVDRNATSLTVNGAVDRAAFRFGNSLGSFTAASFSRSFLSAGDNIGTITISGEVFQTNISAGADLGRDAAPGGTGLNADVLSSGNIGTVTIGGNFLQSSLTAGYLRGSDGYFGTGDDLIAAGRSSIGTVTIAGSQTGSTRNSESYRIASNGTIGQVRIANTVFSGTRGNFATEAPVLQPESLQVEDIRVNVVAGISTAELIFNQPVDTTTISGALSVSEVRGTGDVVVRLVEGIDYTITYDNASNTARVTFSPTVTARNLPVTPGRPGPGVYRFEIDQNKIRARLVGVSLDGDGNGQSEPNDSFSGDTFVGDVGDRLTPGVVFTGPGGSHRVDLYGPTSLDFVLDNNRNSDGLPDPNITYTVRGFIGDHPDNDTNFFRFGGDVDVYSITLLAGQILRLGAMGGTAQLAPQILLDPNGKVAGSDTVVPLFTDRENTTALTFGSDYLIKVTGTYYIVIGNAQDVANPGVVTNPPTPPGGGIGSYHFTVTVFDDGDSGFNATTDSGNGTPVVNAPAPAVFAGPDQVFGTADDLSSVTIGSFVFTYDRGPDNLYNTADDLVTGVSRDGSIVSTRDGNGNLVSLISASIGPAGHSGIPSESAADVDIFRLNNGQPIAPGTRMTITVKLTDLGADLGSASYGSISETRGQVQFALFDISSSTDIDDGTLVFSPTDFRANGGTPNTVIADNGSTRYGYDANGDFYISFIAPDRIDAPGQAARFAVYIQGIRNTDYQIEVVTHAGTETTQRNNQNFLIETAGGVIDWLEAGGQTTTLRPFLASVLGFNGTINGLPVQDYIVTSLVAQLNSLFRGSSGFNVTFSANPADFEFQPFSTIFLTSEVDPISSIFNPFAFDTRFSFGNEVSETIQPYGYSQHSDALNADLEDEAVVFVPSFSLQGFSPSKADVDQFVQATTAAIARRAGELMGLRITEAYEPTTSTFDPMAANSVDNRPGAGRTYSLPGFDRSLSDPLDSVNRTDFYLGQQNARSLLDKVLNRL